MYLHLLFYIHIIPGAMLNFERVYNFFIFQSAGLCWLLGVLMRFGVISPMIASFSFLFSTFALFSNWLFCVGQLSTLKKPNCYWTFDPSDVWIVWTYCHMCVNIMVNIMVNKLSVFTLHGSVLQNMFTADKPTTQCTEFFISLRYLDHPFTFLLKEPQTHNLIYQSSIHFQKKELKS